MDSFALHGFDFGAKGDGITDDPSAIRAKRESIRMGIFSRFRDAKTGKEFLCKHTRPSTTSNGRFWWLFRTRSPSSRARWSL